MGYFNYHAKAHRLIAEGHLVRCEYVEDWNGIRPALVLYFDNSRPMPIRQHRFAEYEQLLKDHPPSSPPPGMSQPGGQHSS